MKFRNFEKIGLTNEDEIKDFLGCTRMQDFISTEYYIQTKIRNASEFYKKRFNDKEEIIVCLINKECETGNSLLCVIEPYVSVSAEEVKYNYYTRDGLVERAQFPKFKTLKEATEFTDKLYGLASHEEVAIKSQQLSGEGENS